jgi:hypothetical protein
MRKSIVTISLSLGQRFLCRMWFPRVRRSRLEPHSISTRGSRSLLGNMGIQPLSIASMM